MITAAYWEIGRRIVASEQGGQARAGYGQAVIARLADDLTRRFGRGFGRANLASMRAFYSAWPAAQIFQTVSGKSAAPENIHTQSGKSLPAQDLIDAMATAPDYMALVSRHASNVGYSLDSLMRASPVVNCQLIRALS